MSRADSPRTIGQKRARAVTMASEISCGATYAQTGRKHGLSVECVKSNIWRYVSREGVRDEPSGFMDLLTTRAANGLKRAGLTTQEAVLAALREHGAGYLLAIPEMGAKSVAEICAVLGIAVPARKAVSEAQIKAAATLLRRAGYRVWEPLAPLDKQA